MALNSMWATAWMKAARPSSCRNHDAAVRADARAAALGAAGHADRFGWRRVACEGRARRVRMRRRLRTLSTTLFGSVRASQRVAGLATLLRRCASSDCAAMPHEVRVIAAMADGVQCRRSSDVRHSSDNVMMTSLRSPPYRGARPCRGGSRRLPLLLGLVRAQLLDALEVAGLDAGDVLAVEARSIELLDAVLGPGHRFLQVGRSW